jgi:hypothetical protein
MSNLFLSAPAVKLLMVAGVDRLDGPLTMAQMQGKFQLSVLPGVGHCIQEDVRHPSTFFRTVLPGGPRGSNYYLRFDISWIFR